MKKFVVFLYKEVIKSTVTWLEGRDMDNLVNDQGFIVQAYFSGRRSKIIELCKILGIDTEWTNGKSNKKKRNLSVGISEIDKITPEKLELAKKTWDSQ